MILKIKILCCVLFAQGLFLRGQYINWQSFDTIISNRVDAIYYDSTDGSTYIGGFYYRIDTDTIWGMGKYKNGQWYRMGDGINWDRTMPFCATCWPNPVKDIMKYHDTLYITGDILFSGSTTLNGIAWWDGNNWQPIIGNSGTNGLYGFGLNFEIYNDELYVMGVFDTIAGVPAKSIAKYNGITWQPVFDLPQISPFNNNRIYDMEYYNGELYLGGTFANSSDGIYHLIKWDGADWVFPGFGAYGIADVSKLFTFQGELYVTGQWSKYANSSNVGSCIAKYNGSSWIAVGDGAFYAPYDLGAIRAYAIKNDTLYLGGSFDVCNSTRAYNIIRYDGDFWCSIDTTFHPGGFPEVMTFIHDTLFIGGSFPVHMGMAYCVDENYTDNCNIDQTGLESSDNLGFSVYPNPIVNYLTINFPDENTHANYSVYDVSGRLIKTGLINQNNMQIDFTNYIPGFYLIEIIAGDKKVSKKLMKI